MDRAAGDRPAHPPDRLPRRLPETGARPDHPVGQPADRPCQPGDPHPAAGGGHRRCVGRHRYRWRWGAGIGVHLQRRDRGWALMSSLLLAAASVAKLKTPHIDYLSILPILIMMGGAVLLVTVSSLFRQVMGVSSATFITV